MARSARHLARAAGADDPTLASPTEAEPAAADVRAGSTLRRVRTPAIRRRRGRTGLYLVDAVALVAVGAALGWGAGAALAPLAVAALAVAVLLRITDLYRHRLTLSVLEEVPAVASRVALAWLPAQAILAATGAPATVLVALPVVSAVALVAVRAVAYPALRALRVRGRACGSALLVGDGVALGTLADRLVSHPELGASQVRLLRAAELDPDRPEATAVEVADRLEARLVVVGEGVRATVVDALRTVAATRPEVFVVDPYGSGVLDARSDRVGGLTVRAVPPAAQERPTWRLKRTVDLFTAGLGLVAAGPVMALAAAAVKLSSPGPVLFRQTRLGRDGTDFDMIKFRTLPVDHVDGTGVNTPDHAYRIPVGRVLRQSSIDELPQLYNVLRGHMTLVGPRPERPHVAHRLAEEVPGYAHRTRLPMGCTGWAQVHGLRGDTSMIERVELDNQYIDQWSLWRDVVILARTPAAVVQAHLNARRRRRDARDLEGTP